MPQKKINSRDISVSPVSVRNQQDAYVLMRRLGVSQEGAKIMSPKSVYSLFIIEGIKSWEANIIKQHLLSLGSDAAIERAALIKDIETSILVFASRGQFQQLCRKLRHQPFALKTVAEKIESQLRESGPKSCQFIARDKKINLSKPVVCGILNITGDSFSGDGLLGRAKNASANVVQSALKAADSMLKEGASMLDIGGESTRPFSRPLKAGDEIRRVIPVIRALRKAFKRTPLSLDTYKFAVAKAAVDEGIDIINDIWALRRQPQTAALISRNNLGCVLMHMQGTPATMQKNPRYKDLTGEIHSFFKERLDYCRAHKINAENICLDPGIGFGKSLDDNIGLIKSLGLFTSFGRPLFLGLSRKSFIGKIVGRDTGWRLAGTLAASVMAATSGASIFRTHDVASTVDALKVASKIIYK